VQGAAQIKNKLPEAVSIFILPPDRATLEWRLRSRGSDAKDDIDRRLDTATREIENYDKYDYILVNDRLEESTEALKALVLAERVRRSGAPLSTFDSPILESAERYRLENVRGRLRPILDSFREGASGKATGS
jgi:guanylate kinase